MLNWSLLFGFRLKRLVPCWTKAGHSPLCSAAAVASDLMAAPTNTPCCQLKASYMRGTPEIRQTHKSGFNFHTLSFSLVQAEHQLHRCNVLMASRLPSGLRPPKMMASMGTPSGDSHSGSIIGHWLAGLQKRELGWAQVSPDELKEKIDNHFKNCSPWLITCVD